MKRSALLYAASAIFVTSACKAPAPATKAPPPTPAPVVASQPRDAGPAPDARYTARLGMMERHAIWKAKKEAEEMAFAEEKARVMKFDKGKLPKHQALVDFERKTREALDDAASKLNGKFDATDQLKKLAVSQQKDIEAQIDGLRAMDPEGGNSAITGDHDVILHLLANDYPMAILAFFQGNTKPLAEVREVLDKREQRIGAWLDEIKGGGKKAAGK